MALLTVGFVQAQVTMDYYLPQDVTYDPKIPTPESVLGYVPGEWHVSHDQLAMYMRTLAAASDRMTIEEYGRSYENRPLYLLTITSPANHSKIDQIKADHKKLVDPAVSGSLDVKNMPGVLWMGYSVHGNEPSGSNAALMVAYYFAAAQGQDIENKLKDLVILFDPSINPDGLNRFASWVNTHKSKNLVSDPNSREFNEAYPGGRTNHYWFDLNRDWLPVQHPESRGRIKKFQEWRPNILTDHHEMGTNSTFFFQPGVPARNNPNTPWKNFELTEKIGTYHAKFLDQIGSLYYSQEGFDDFYYGKGSTYPDVQGSIGILFEQASSRGHLQESVNGPLSFPFTIRNQFVTSMSTLQAGYEMREELLNFQRNFYQEAKKEAAADPVKAYIFGADEDKTKAAHLADIISFHDIEMYRPAGEVKINRKVFKPESSYIIPTNQPQYKLINSMFETRTTFKDSLFYDISSWTLPYAFNLEFDKISGKPSLGERVTEVKRPEGKVLGGVSDYAYAFEWFEYYAARAAYQLMDKGLNIKVMQEPFTSADGREFARGTILIPNSLQKYTKEELHALMEQVANDNGVDIYALNTGNTKGVMLGSPNLTNLEKPRVALLVESGASSNNAGDVWHLLDQRFDIPTTLLPTGDVNRTDLSRYNVIIMVSGNYGNINKDVLRNWVAGGGTIVAMQGAVSWLAANGIGNFKFKSGGSGEENPAQLPYASRSDFYGAQRLGGAIFNAKLDLTHPVAYGHKRAETYLFRNTTLFMEPASSPFANPVMYTDQPLASGYITKPQLAQLRNSAGGVVSSVGRGSVIGFTDNPNFRAFWFGTNKLFINSIFFGQINR